MKSSKMLDVSSSLFSNLARSEQRRYDVEGAVHRETSFFFLLYSFYGRFSDCSYINIDVQSDDNNVLFRMKLITYFLFCYFAILVVFKQIE